MSILLSILQFLSLTFSHGTFEPNVQNNRFGVERSDLVALQGPGPINPCRAAGCR